MKSRLLFTLLFICWVCCSFAQRLAILCDTHVSPGMTNEAKLIEAIEEINATDFDAVVLCGDLTNEGSDVELVNMKRILDQITHPFFAIPGNHENNWSQSATKTFIDLWGADRFAGEIGDLVIVGTNCGPYMKMGDGHVKQEDIHWLDSTLKERVKDGKRVVSFNHYALNSDMDNYKDYIAVVEKYPVIAQFNGHYHTYKRYQAGDIEGTYLRALDMRNGDYGYSIVEVDPQWVHIYEKKLSQNPIPKFAFPVQTIHSPSQTAQCMRWQQPQGFKVEKVWTDSASIFTRLGFDRDNVYFGNSLGQAKAISKQANASTQGVVEPIWIVETGASLFARPVAIEKGLVAVPTCDGILTVNAADGKVVKSYTSKEGPYIADGLYQNGMYLQGGYKRFENRDSRTAKLKWSFNDINNYCQASPVMDNGEIFFGAWDRSLRCLDAKTGKLKWIWQHPASNNLFSPGNVVPVVTQDLVFIVTPDRVLRAIDRKSGEQLWQDKSVKYRESLGHSQDMSRIYAKTMDGELIAVAPKADGFQPLWIVDLGLGYEHAPCVVVEKDGVVYCGSRRGILTGVNPYKQEVLWSLPLGVSEINGIDVDPYSDQVYVSLIEGTIFRVSKI